MLALGTLSFLPSLAQGKEDVEQKQHQANFQDSQLKQEFSMDYKIKNVRLETGFVYQDKQVVATKTALFTLGIKDGIIVSISENTPLESAIDAKGFLALPMFCDMHIHLDKTYYGQPWKGVPKKKGSIKQMIALEQQILPDLLKDSTFKANKLIELLQSKGSGFARSHVNIEPTSALRSLKNLEVALKQNQDSFLTELVAFPQHGLFYTNSLPYMKQAAELGVDFIGGLDPTSVDGALEPSMDATLDLALTYNKGIDIHLHETGPSGVKTIEYLIEQVKQNPVLKGKTYISHGFALAFMDPGHLKEIAQELNQQQIGIISTIPFSGFSMPLLELDKAGVKVFTGNDSIVDHWDTTGSGSVLQKANLFAQLYRQNDELGLSRCLKYATRGILPLDEQGVMQWPKIGDPANLVLVNALCSSEAVSRISPVESLVVKGKVIY